MYKALTMNLNNFQGEQLQKLLEKCLKHLWSHPEKNYSGCYRINFSTQTD